MALWLIALAAPEDLGSIPSTYTYIAASVPGCLSSVSLAVCDKGCIQEQLEEERVYFVLNSCYTLSLREVKAGTKADHAGIVLGFAHNHLLRDDTTDNGWLGLPTSVISQASALQ